jgi:hypothetical protein
MPYSHNSLFYQHSVSHQGTDSTQDFHACVGQSWMAMYAHAKQAHSNGYLQAWAHLRMESLLKPWISKPDDPIATDIK